MTKKEFSAALTIAQTIKTLSWDNLARFDGFGLKDFQKIQTTITDLAALISYQCIMLNGQIDYDALDEIWNCRHKFEVVGLGDHELMNPDTAPEILLANVLLAPPHSPQ